MSEIKTPTLSGVSETLFIPLYIRAMESQRPDALIKDERAEALVRRLDQETLRKTTALTEDSTRVVMILKSREFDRFAKDFLGRHSEAIVVHMGCGLDTRFERLDNGQAVWYDLDLPEVIEIRRKLIEGENERHQYLACSVFENIWMETVREHQQRPFLFLAEGVFMYFTEAQVKSLVQTLCERFPGAELVFDAFSPFMRWAHNFKVTRTGIGAHLHWALKHPQDLEQWHSGIRLLDERYPFQAPEPRIRRAWKIRIVPFLATAIGVFRYQI